MTGPVNYKLPFPWFGGKSRVAAAWESSQQWARARSTYQLELALFGTK